METEVDIIQFETTKRKAHRLCYILFYMLEERKKDDPLYLPLLDLFNTLAHPINLSLEKISEETARFEETIKHMK